MPKILGVIFDLDATLIDSLPLHYQAYSQTFQRHGLVLPEEVYYREIGGTSMECFPGFLNGQTSPVPLKQLHQEKVALSLELLDTMGVQPLETAKLLSVFQGQYRMSVASAGSRLFVEKVIDSLGWRHYFTAIITGNDVQRGKPDPEAFLLAAKAMEVEPINCLVFEDSAAGIQAAQNAGMSYFNVRGTV